MHVHIDVMFLETVVLEPLATHQVTLHNQYIHTYTHISFLYTISTYIHTHTLVFSAQSVHTYIHTH
jgi:hypothetical protein